MLDVLLYLFEHYFIQQPDLEQDRGSLQSCLLEAGFSPAEIHKAFDWLDGLSDQRGDQLTASSPRARASSSERSSADTSATSSGEMAAPNSIVSAPSPASSRR